MAEEKAFGARFIARGDPLPFLMKRDVVSSERLVVFATPSLDHRVSMEYLESAVRTEWALARAGIKSAYQGLGGDCFVDKARNRLLTQYLVQFPNSQDFFFLDDDIGWPAEKVLEFLNRPEEMLAGVYPRKTDNPEYPVTLEVEQKTQGLIEKDGLFKAMLVPTGFLRIKRSAIEKIAKSCASYTEQNADGTTGRMIEFFRTGINPDDGRWWGEDSWLCAKARKAGIDIWVDPNIDFTHRGTKKWYGNFGPSLQAWLKQNPEKAVESLPMLKSMAEESA